MNGTGLNGADAARLRVEGLSHAYEGTPVLREVSLTIDPGEIVCLLGPSGCGKSTLLRLVAGLEPVQAGRIAMDGTPVAAAGLHVPPERRQVGLVFQDFALFPHLSVLDNVAFGLFREPPARRRARALEMLRLLDMADRATDFPHVLSGGQQQRVALARALAPAPRLLLLDEPFSGLDAALRGRMRDDTLHVLKRSGTAALLVTHDPEEAMFMADRIAVMHRGRIVQTGEPAALYAAPADGYVAGLLGEVNRFAARVEAGAVATPFGLLPAPHLAEGAAVEVLIRPEALLLDAAGCGGAVTARVLAARMLGRTSLVHLALPAPDGGETHLHARVRGDFLPASGTVCAVSLPPGKAFIFPATPSRTGMR